MRHLLSLSILLTGCAHMTRPREQTPVTRVFPAAVPASAGAAAPAMAPADSEEYYVGMIADPADPDFAYRPGSLWVQMRPPGPGGGSGELRRTGPATASRQANYHPDPTETEISTLVARSQNAISALTEENARLTAQLQDLQGSAQTGPTMPAAVPTTDGAGVKADRPEDDGGLNLVKPNGDYVIELDANLFLAPIPATNNPFVQLYQPPVAFHEVALVIEAALPGPTASAVINDQLYSVGDRLEGLTVYRIAADTVYLRKDAFLLECPVSEKSLKLRLP
jgi:hypothetical protein